MAADSANSKDHLLPLRHSEGDLFICDVSDAILKDVIPQLEHPFFSLSKKPETKIRRYEHNGKWLEIVPSVKGMATIYDKDILIYCISQVMEKLKRNEPVGPRLKITSYDLLVFANRGTSGRDYMQLCESLDRLEGTRIKTNIRNEAGRESFGLIDASSVTRKFGLDGRIQHIEIKLSDWVFDAIRDQEVLTLHRDYFRLGKALEKRIYELARKHCGRQSTWHISLETLLKKSGSQSSTKRFRQHLKGIALHDHLPDYRLVFDEEKDMVVFLNRENAWVDRPLPSSSDDETLPLLPAETYDQAREAAPGYDIHALESEWREFWENSGKPTLANPPAAFVGFCRSRHKRAPLPRRGTKHA
ncbi:replication initiator protein A [Acidicapsa acidisoli]|uniref:replication initiator protein A n=1 Tax=Acidicapsa acidisoli TaxID=1615681 RepID=UPI0021E0E048|nr:replication initiator protein A [Acidicapsa acidisoli]